MRLPCYRPDCSLWLAVCATALISCRTAPPPVVAKPCPTQRASKPEPPNVSVAPPAPTCGLPLDLKRPEWPTQLPSTYEREREPAPTGTQTLVLLPDTQYYTQCRYPHLRRQAEYLAEQHRSRGVLAAITLGDLTDRNTDDQWQFVRESLSPIPENLPILLTEGNHDVGKQGTSDSRDSLLSTYFPETWARSSGALRAVKTPGSIENAFYSIDTGRFRLGVLILEWSPRRSTVEWANQVLTQFKDHRVIIATHAYLYEDGTRYDYASREGTQHWNPLEYRTANGAFAEDPSHDGELLWNSLVRLHSNVFLVLSGHVLGQGTGRMTSLGNAGNLVHQVMVNYQMLDEGGLGYLRLLELFPDGKTLHMKTYSPSLGLYSYAADQDFRLQVEPPLFVPTAEPEAASGVTSGKQR